MTLPVKYNQKAHCTDIMQQMGLGKSDTQVMADWGISRSTFYRWLKKHPELKEAHEIGKVQFDAFHEQLGIEGMLGTKKVHHQFWKDLGTIRNGHVYNKGTGGTNNTQINIDTMNVLQEQTNEELMMYIKTQLENNPELKNVIEHDG